MSKLIDLTGQIFGNWEVIKKDGVRRNTYWICRCINCGNTKSVRSTHLRQGKTKSCGCANSKFKAGDVVGYLRLLEIDEERSGKGKGRFWKCKCLKEGCGRVFTTSASRISQHRVLSCGCSKLSKGEVLIKRFFEEKNIPFDMQVSYKDLKGDKKVLKFDFAFYVKNKNFLLEYQGEQHFKSVDYYGGEDGYKKRIEYDNKKRDYCINNNIQLYYITYKQDIYKELNKIMEEIYSE